MKRTLAFAAFAGIVTLLACGSDDQSEFVEGSPKDGDGPGGGLGGGPGFGGGGDNGNGNGNGNSPFGACATETKQAEQVPLDMMIGLDTSFSMDFDDKWINVREALRGFVTTPAYAELGVGLQFFPVRKQCSVAAYADPAVKLDLLPKVSQPVRAALDAQQMAGGTPMVPLLQGLAQYLKANARAGRKAVIVLATDGVPDDTCLSSTEGQLPNTLDNAVATAAAALDDKPSVSTFVVGVGSELGALDAIASAGGTNKAFILDPTQDVQKAFRAALDDIRRQSIPCSFDIPQIGAIDTDKINVSYTDAAGTSTNFQYVNDADGCAKAPKSGWYFDDEASPKKVLLCSETCDAVKSDDRGRVDVVFGCPRLDVR